MTDTMQALYRYTAEGRFSSYLTGADYREVCRVLDKLEQTLRQLLPAGERDLLSRLETARLEQRDLELEAMFQAAWTAAQEVPCNLRPRACPSSPARSKAALPLAMPLRGEPDRRHLPQKTAADRGLLVPRPPSQGKSRKGPQSLPGFRRQAAERTSIIFPGGMYVGENSSQAASVDHGRPRRPWSARSRPARPFAETGKAGLCEGPLAQMFLGTFGRILFRLPTSPAAPAAGRRSGPGSCCPGPGSA